MSSNINLLGNKIENKTLSKFFTKISILRFIATGLIFVVSVSSIILFILISISPLPALQEQEKAVGEALAQQSSDIATIAVINDRSKDISRLLAQRQSFDTIIDRVRSKMPNGMSVTAFTVTKDTLSITVASKSLSSLDQFINKLIQAAEEKKDFSRVTLGDLAIEGDIFLLKVTVTLL